MNLGLSLAPFFKFSHIEHRSSFLMDIDLSIYRILQCQSGSYRDATKKKGSTKSRLGSKEDVLF